MDTDSDSDSDSDGTDYDDDDYDVSKIPPPMEYIDLHKIGLDNLDISFSG